ncbi:hypothetical protein [Bosea sp. AS-1]|uniref:hypothetical protein n=1 Tax=Bosea sp. AS-1 TaxID=2015316 RepID=UPI0018E05327|nr:hypothetical protein [Bosea sp. AS-1]
MRGIIAMRERPFCDGAPTARFLLSAQTLAPCRRHVKAAATAVDKPVNASQHDAPIAEKLLRP